MGKTILPANNENKQYAVDWLNSLEAEIGTLKENRSRFHPKELLYVKPMPGVVAGWFGLTMAISYDPDLIFVFTGKLPIISYRKFLKHILVVWELICPISHI